MEGGRQALNLVFTVVLASLLGPEAYGLAAMGLVFVMFIDLVQRQGMAAAVIQRKSLELRHKDTAFWLLMAASAVMLVAAIAAAGWWADLNDEPQLRLVILGMCPMIPLRGLSVIQDALLRRAMAFRELATRSISAVVAGGVAGMVAATLGLGVWALVLQQVVYAAVETGVLWKVSGWRPAWRFSGPAARDLLGFSGGAFLSGVATFINNQADALLIGLFFGPFVVGVYRLGLRLVENLVSAVLRPVQSIALPELAPHQDHPAALRRRVVRLTRLGASTALPALGLLAGVALPAVAILGDDWTTAGPVIQILCVVGAVRVLVVIDGPLLQAVGSPYLQAGFSAAAAGISALTFTAAGFALQDLPLAEQAVGIASARAVVWGVAIVTLHVVIVRRHAALPLRAQLRPIVWPAVSGLSAYLVGSLVAAATSGTPGLVRLALTGAAAGSVAGAIFWQRVPEGRAMLHDLLSRRRSRRVAVPDT